jgi:hypothetical protein
MSKSNEELIRELIESFANLKQKMEDPNYIHLDTSIQQLIKNQEDMKKDMSDLKERLLSPYDGAIVEIRKNTEFRQEQEKRERDYEKLLQEHNDLVKWKGNFVRAFWVLFTTASGVIAYILTNMKGG